jgi:hypothetical protein
VTAFGDPVLAVKSRRPTHQRGALEIQYGRFQVENYILNVKREHPS